ncbi:hypothetical protein EMIHUDRAFT_121803 [Emiliania huxleyi CCMP1516]|uniref:Uncharacterized protein n=2 Tax=Emiliania huxleyi TaxID=2903 RepID=A0A0D3KZA3_EMIH1|nr:hypothetical protein EMIHUDRAFT_238170 [Emiliania huxleyi CCMP1516]XP_005791061.1 hypothetical protein EMIHUDRAFT_224423 [Emiliania huxleyi CCMP1516]XP_005793517.1 hypothetical protein EMIHUDRAFT_121803 [Emiliania huxleyi CCMP1516]EOD24887.1 hypothetical protein EMIHUDRAFT_238170 [Emiliania huxleyi CCMP1516]EOD38632.1 hypothetical protein EMIHUDRAFT_224423 [Emiliania huxleyi CCMP1516]EOD41088.1 hypothetical protein EMIHUDRAFT_121803 [Emiliania huxleyi CCMP1516]|eukprot:XP_005777316.1 hypothetical protein EMIHUDRAFT_238170 [Emiliania huxleyi CCMP1516]
MPPPDWTKLDDVVVVEIARHLTRECIYPTDAMDGTLLDHARVARSNVNSAGSILATCKAWQKALDTDAEIWASAHRSLRRAALYEHGWSMLVAAMHSARETWKTRTRFLADEAYEKGVQAGYCMAKETPLLPLSVNLAAAMDTSNQGRVRATW